MPLQALKSPLSALAGVSGCICQPSCKTAVKGLAGRPRVYYMRHCNDLHFFIKGNALPHVSSAETVKGHQKRLNGFLISADMVRS